MPSARNRLSPGSSDMQPDFAIVLPLRMHGLTARAAPRGEWYRPSAPPVASRSCAPPDPATGAAVTAGAVHRCIHAPARCPWSTGLPPSPNHTLIALILPLHQCAPVALSAGSGCRVSRYIPDFDKQVSRATLLLAGPCREQAALRSSRVRETPEVTQRGGNVKGRRPCDSSPPCSLLRLDGPIIKISNKDIIK